MRKRTMWMVMAGLLGSMSAFGADVWVFFSPAQIRDVPGGRSRYIDVVVHSNEQPSEAQQYTFTTNLSGSGTGGNCSVSTQRTTKVKPSVSLLRFEVFYPAGSTGPLVNYTLDASVIGAPDTSPGNNELEFTYRFPGGGQAPTCVQLQ